MDPRRYGAQNRVGHGVVHAAQRMPIDLALKRIRHVLSVLCIRRDVHQTNADPRSQRALQGNGNE
jgi:hypothetical protein